MPDELQVFASKKTGEALQAQWERMHKQLCEIAAVEMDWLQRLTSGDDAMKQISAILTGKSR